MIVPRNFAAIVPASSDADMLASVAKSYTKQTMQNADPHLIPISFSCLFWSVFKARIVLPFIDRPRLLPPRKQNICLDAPDKDLKSALLVGENVCIKTVRADVFKHCTGKEEQILEPPTSEERTGKMLLSAKWASIQI